MDAHIMLDLETMGTNPGSAIISIGAVAFDPLGVGHREEFYRNVSLQSCLDAGLMINHDTLLWWMTQSQAARNALLKNCGSLTEVIYQFDEWFTKTDAKKIWSHGAPFDLPILKAAHDAAGAVVPWEYSNERDTRTIYDLAGVEPDRKKGVHHKALDDAIAQAEAVEMAYKKLGIRS